MASTSRWISSLGTNLECLVGMFLPIWNTWSLFSFPTCEIEASSLQLPLRIAQGMQPDRQQMLPIADASLFGSKGGRYPRHYRGEVIFCEKVLTMARRSKKGPAVSSRSFEFVRILSLRDQREYNSTTSCSLTTGLISSRVGIRTILPLRFSLSTKSQSGASTI